MRLFVAGLKAGTYAEGGEEYDVQVRGEAVRWRADREALALVDVPSSRYRTRTLSRAMGELRGRKRRARQSTRTVSAGGGR